MTTTLVAVDTTKLSTFYSDLSTLRLLSLFFTCSALLSTFNQHSKRSTISAFQHSIFRSFSISISISVLSFQQQLRQQEPDSSQHNHLNNICTNISTIQEQVSKASNLFQHQHQHSTTKEQCSILYIICTTQRTTTIPSGDHNPSIRARFFHVSTLDFIATHEKHDIDQ